MLARSDSALVSSPHPLASHAALAILADGGNAIEAAIAASAVLCVVYPHMTGLGGDAFWLLADAQGNALGIAGAGQAAASLQTFSGAIPMRGPAAMLTCAAAVDSWRLAWEHSQTCWQGRFGWRELLASAIRFADAGFPVSDSQAFWHRTHAAQLQPQPGFASIFEPDQRPPRAGEHMHLPALADSLRLLASEGPRDFYEGRLAGRLAQALQDAGSVLSAQDLASCRAEYVTPLRIGYRDGEALNLPPPSQGLSSLQILGMLDRFDLRRLPESGAEHVHLQVEAVKLALAERNALLGDIDRAPVLDALLSHAHLARMAAAIDPVQAHAWPFEGQPADTVWLGVRDANGNCVSLIQSLFHDFGSGVVLGDTGILWHNRGAAFRPDLEHPNGIAPGRRPLHTLNPAMYFQGGKPRLLYGSQGGDGQPQTQTQILTRIIDFDMDPWTALCRPRFLLGRGFLDTRDNLKLEADFDPAVIEQLRQRGHNIGLLEPLDPATGQAGVIRIHADGHVDGAHDPRGAGRALGMPR